MDQWLNVLIEQFRETPLLEWIGVSFGIAEVFLARFNKVALYPCGIVGILATMVVLFEAGLYAEILLNGYYLVMSIYGWYHWVHGKGGQSRPITTCSPKEHQIALGLLAFGFPILYFLLRYGTDSSVPVWDAWVSITAWIGMWLLAKRKIENWIWLNISNAFAIPLFIHKGLIWYAVLTLILFIVAISGYLSWRKLLEKRA